MTLTFQNGVMGSHWVCKAILIMLIFGIVPSAFGKRKVVNYIPPRDAHPRRTTSVKPYQFPTYGNMEDIIKSPPFRNRVSDVAEDPNVWSEALSAYDKMMSNLPRGSDPKVDPLRNIQRGIFVPWASAAEYTDPSLRDKKDNVASHYNLDGLSPVAGSSHVMDWSGPENEVGSHHDHVKKVGGHHHEDDPKSKIEIEASKDSGVVGGQLKRDHEGGESTAKPELGREAEVNSHFKKCSRPNMTDPGFNQDITLNERLLENSVMTPELMYGGCGGAFPKGKVCYGVPAGCIEKQMCRLAVTFGWDEESAFPGDSEEDQITVNLAGESSGSGFVALAFSHDRFLGDDIVVYCIDTETAMERRVALFGSITDGVHSNMQRKRGYFQLNFCPNFGYPGDGILACSFRLSTRVFRDNGDSLDILMYPYHLMLAFGRYMDDLPQDDPDYGALKYKRLVQWSENPIILRNALMNPEIVEPRSPILILLHVIPAVISIVFLLPSASFQAKYGREIMSYPAIICGRFRMPMWLWSHTRLAGLSIPLLIISTLSILMELNFLWSSQLQWPFLHSVSGVICLVLQVVSIVLGYTLKVKQGKAGNKPKKASNKLEKAGNKLEKAGNKPKMAGNKLENAGRKPEKAGKKPKKANTKFKIRSWAHWLTGNLTYYFGIFCVLTAPFLSMGQAPCVVEYFAYLHVALHVLTHVVMMMDTRTLVKKLDNKHMCQRAILGPMIPFHKKFSSYEESAGVEHWKKRRLVILFYFWVSFLCAFTISGLMFLPVVLCRQK